MQDEEEEIGTIPHKIPEGSRIIETENTKSGYSDEKVEWIKREYLDYVESTAEYLEEMDFTKEEYQDFSLKTLIGAALKKIWTDFEYESEVTMLIESFDKKGLDCKTSAALLCDILDKLEIDATVVQVPFHTIAKITNGDEVHYIESTQEGFFYEMYTREEITDEYGSIISEYDLREESDRTAFLSVGVGEYLYLSGRYEQAIDAFEKVIVFRPDNADAYNMIGNCLFGLGRIEESIEYYSKTMELMGNRAVIYLNMADAFFEIGLFEDAIVDYKNAMHDDGFRNGPLISDVYCWFSIGECYEKMGKDEEAIDAYSKVIKIDPLFSRAYLKRSEIYFRTGQLEKSNLDIIKYKELEE